MINSPEVCLGITRQHAQVGHKNIIIFSYKYHLGRFCIKDNNLCKKLHNITLCNFWHMS
jgi:hypothetical protein